MCLTFAPYPAPPSPPGANAKLRYQITSGNTGGVFDMEPEVGTVFIAQPLDYELQKRYKLLVLASDGRWEDYAAVVVNVVNKNDEAPVFSMNEYYGSVTEELDGSPVFVLQVGPSEGIGGGCGLVKCLLLRGLQSHSRKVKGDFCRDFIIFTLLL